MKEVFPELEMNASPDEKSKDIASVDWSKLSEIPTEPINPNHVVTYKYRNALLNEKPLPVTDSVERPYDWNGLDNANSSLFQSKHSSAFQKVPFLPWAPFSNSHSSVPFDKIDCPTHPAPGYPKHYPLSVITNNWNTDNTEIPPFHYDSLCHFDYQNPEDNKKAYNYREAEVPFVVYNIPEVDEIAKRWNNIDYLHEKLGIVWISFPVLGLHSLSTYLTGSKRYRTEKSKTNHFMYWMNSGHGNSKLRGWTPPTEIVTEKFEDWLEKAVKGQNKTLDERKHEYFRCDAI
jgi:hypothetical protein